MTAERRFRNESDSRARDDNYRSNFDTIATASASERAHRSRAKISLTHFHSLRLLTLPAHPVARKQLLLFAVAVFSPEGDSSRLQFDSLLVSLARSYRADAPSLLPSPAIIYDEDSI